ncbi:MAG: hypothetical protein GX364_01425 [Firmicutes bacterium]|jgi:predicted CoA-substrate-specific enzyme activase|nr:hypothetical protein [Bacillota bacterium]
MITLGMDVGSLFTKAVLMKDGEIIASTIRETTGNIAGEIDSIIDEVAGKANITRKDINICVSSGQGEDLVKDADFMEDDVACIAVASRHLLPETELTIDIGGQNISTILTDPDGDILNFMRNDKCASGSGRFVEVISSALRVNMDDLDSTIGEATKRISVSTQCAVFAESEIISYVNQGEAVPNILAGVCDAMARIIVSQAMRVGPVDSFTVTGGVARVNSIIRVLEERLKGKYQSFPIDPQLAVAYGAALIGQSEGEDAV